MPISPFQRAAEEGLNQPEGSSTVGSGKRKRKSKPTSKARSRRQKTKDRYAHAREDAQLEGLIPTTPEEALKSERVPACAQGSQPMSELVAQAIRKGWNVDEAKKPGLVAEMVAIVMDTEMSAKAKVAAFNALRLADKDQYERDHPDTVKAGGGGNTIVNVNVETIESVQQRLVEVRIDGDDSYQQNGQSVPEAECIPAV